MSLTTLILAGGLGTRLQPVIKDSPKVLSPVCGRPFLSYILDQLVGAGIKDVVLCIGHLGEMVMESFGPTYKGISIRYSREPVLLGTAGALRQAYAYIQSENTLVMNGDSYCDINLQSFIRWSIEGNYNASLVLLKAGRENRYGNVQTNEQGRVLRFAEKKQINDQGWINGGIYILKKTLLESIPVEKKFSLEHEFFPDLAGKGELYGFNSYGKFIDIGTPGSYQLAEKFFANS